MEIGPHVRVLDAQVFDGGGDAIHDQLVGGRFAQGPGELQVDLVHGADRKILAAQEARRLAGLFDRIVEERFGRQPRKDGLRRGRR